MKRYGFMILVLFLATNLYSQTSKTDNNVSSFSFPFDR